MPAIPVHHTATSESPWDAGENVKRLKKGEPADYYRKEFAWEDPNSKAKSDFKFPHHEVSESGDVGAANVKACQSIIGILNGGMGGADIPDADRRGVYDHARAHLEDAGEKDIPDLKASAPAGQQRLQMRFDADESGKVNIAPGTANDDDRTVDVVWYTGASVPRFKRNGQPYMLRLDMAGAKMDRLNAGAPVFDNHMSGDDFPSAMAGVLGTRAQVGVVQKAWADGRSGKATLKFAKDDPNADQLWGKIKSGIVRNLSFGAWINDMSPDQQVGPKGFDPSDADQEGPQSFVATDWEPFEISPVCVPADFSTTFLSAQTSNTNFPAAKPESTRASARNGETMIETNVNAESARQEGIRLERERVQAIRLAAKPFASQLGEPFIDSLVNEGVSLEASRTRILEKLAANADKFQTVSETVAVTRDATDTRRENMEAALLYRADPKKHQAIADKARDYAGFTLVDLAKECLHAAGVKTRGMNRHEIARVALQGRVGAAEYFAEGMASTSDFPNIVANVANKSMRMAYEAYPSTFKPFCRMVTAADFKPVNRVQISDLPALKLLGEDGEYSRATPGDSKESYSLATYGEIVAITRKTIINDDLQAFTRIPMLLGIAAARLEADTVWSIITGNPAMFDTFDVFSTQHANLLTGAGSALSSTALASAKQSMRLQTAPQGTPLNVTPKFLLVPSSLETTADQLVAPINIASSDFTKVIPTWIRSLQPIVEPRLDANSETAWYLIADLATIDTVEYCYLEGQEGVYTETRQGFDVDGIEIKARMDFAAAAVEYRGLQKNAGA